MAITRSFDDANKVVDWTQEINEIPNQYGFMRQQGYFRVQGTSQTAIVFDKNTTTITLLPQVSRRERNATVGKDRRVETFSLPLAYFKHQEHITPEDIQGWRQPGTPNTEETLANVRLQKFTDGRSVVDQTLEYMQIQAAKGISITPDGVVQANMFTEFGVTQQEINFDLNNTSAVVNDKIAELKRYITANALSGGVIRGIDVFCGVNFFDKLVNHPSIKEAYLNWSSNAQYRQDQSMYMNWGVVDVFEHKGVRFMTYPAVFNLPDGTTDKAVEDDEAFVVPRMDGLFRGYYGPSNKLSLANQPGREIFAFEYRDPRDEYHDIEFETAPLFFATKPKVLVKLKRTA
jgi:hypothetical protein